MPSPCDDCLIKACCTEICEKKELYTTYYRNSLRYYRNSGRTGAIGMTYHPSYKMVCDKLQEATNENAKILGRTSKPQQPVDFSFDM
jgi:hypothetical protein